ncbi:MAG: T9SS type A sorting domain-containing protein [Bacteroidetes bacterium]|nr:T9SS type A sorting domain-containing protein [Bacteroidota bacterium]
MYAGMHRIAHRTVLLLAVTIGFAAAAGELHGQAFQDVHGSSSCREAGRGGVLQLPGGGYIAVGETFIAPTGACSTSDIYIVRTNPNGTNLWSGTYNIGGNDSATSVVLSALNPNVIYVCGVTQNLGGSCVVSRDGFIMRVDITTGAAVAFTYGSGRDEVFYDIVEATGGDNVTTHAGDLIAVGSTTNASGTGRDGYIVRVTSGLGIIWGRQYGGTASVDEYFLGVAEAPLNSPPNVAPDIVAVGATNTTGAGNYDALVARVSGQNGLDGAAPQNIAVFGAGRNEEARSVRQLRVGASAGTLAVVGYSDSRPAPNAGPESFLMRLQGDPCGTPICERYFGDNANGIDGARCVREVPAGAPAGMTPGNLIVTGTTGLGGGTVTGNNVYLAEFSGCSLVTGTEAYGGNGFDEGWSVNIATNASSSETPGYIICGYTQSASLIGADPQQLYLIKTRTNKLSGCNETAIVFSDAAAQFSQHCIDVVNAPLTQGCGRASARVLLNIFNQLCFAPMARHGDGGTNDGVAGVESPSTISLNEHTARFYPNPVTAGAPMNVRFELPVALPVTVTVSDILGNTVYGNTAVYEAGSALHVINTAGWASGRYIVNISAPGTTPYATVVSVVGR